MRKKLLSLLLALSLIGSAVTVDAAGAESIQMTEKTVMEGFSEETGEFFTEVSSEEAEKESEAVSESKNAEETENMEEAETAEEMEDAEEAETIEETEEAETAEEMEDVEEVETAEEAKNTEGTGSAEKGESAKETAGPEKTESPEKTVEEVFVPEEEIVGEDEESSMVEEEYVVTPGYRDFYSESDVREFLEQQAYDELVGANEDATVVGSYEEVVKYLRIQMKARQVNASFQVRSGITEGLGKQIYDAVSSRVILDDAMEENENTPADEGDYIRSNLIGYQSVAYYSSTNLTVEYTFVYTSDAAQEAEVNAAIGTVMDSLALDGKSDYEKLKVIHDYIVNHIDYVDDGTYLSHSTYAALIKGACVCQGYASLFQRMCKMAGIQVRYITGLGNGGGHAWNIVKLGEVWYNVDTTWDDPIGGSLRYTYFLKSDLDFGKHERNEKYLTSDFYAQHPMAQTSYGEDYSGLDKSNQTYRFLNIDGGTLDTVASGKPKILIFICTTCNNSKKTLIEISQSEWIKRDAVDVYAINCDEHTAEAVKEYQETNCPEGNIKFGYTTDTTAINALWYYAKMIETDSVSYPVIAMIDANNQVQYVKSGYLSAEVINKTYLPMLIPGWEDLTEKPLTSVKMSQGELTLDKGETCKLRAVYVPADTTDDTTVSWSSSAPGVAAVDVSGTVTAIGAGNAVITARMGSFAVTCKVTVNPSVYTITFISNDTQYTTMQFRETEAVTGLPVPTRAGYSFTGWYLNGILYHEGGKLNGNITLTAGWKKYETLPLPVCSVASGSTVQKETGIALSCAVEGAKIYYTLDGTTPTTLSQLYTSPIKFASVGAFQIKAIAVKNGYNSSAVAVFQMYVKAWPFIDVAVSPGSWKYDSVKYVYENNIMNGITKPNGTINTFEPDSSLTRGMFATVLYRMASSPAVTYEAKFTDVPRGQYYSNAVIWARQKGIVNGYADGSFGVNDSITREQIAKMLMEYARVQGYTISDRANLNSFPDKNKVSGWATEYMRWAVGVGMISGKNISGKYYLDPQGKATRAECAAMLMRFLQKYQ